ncbi:hypothetical protein ACFU8Q_11835 [Streptomyces sp. NPDC057543]|uniref:hypothetical protein n=1 Tax=Streptomyces sp. NPDC057543 TaxID=3346163 RepID=UPI0036A00A07
MVFLRWGEREGGRDGESTVRKSWPGGAATLNATAGRISYVPIPALTGRTWPLAWHFPPTASGRFVPALLLLNAVSALLG